MPNAWTVIVGEDELGYIAGSEMARRQVGWCEA
jgi:hypothetical protein